MGYLALVQIFQYIFPMLTFPYLVRILGPNNFGELTFCTASIGYVLLVIEYGFSLTATATVSRLRNNKIKLTKYFSAVMFTKLIIGMFAALVFCFVVSITNKFDGLYIVLIAMIPSILGNIAYPVWFFQGIEEMKFITICTLCGKITTIPMTFIFVQSKDDIWIAAIIQGLAILISGLISIWFIFWKKMLGRIEFDFSEVVHCLRDGWHVFLTTASVNLYTSSISVVLGITSGIMAVGYFNAANTIIKAAQGLMTPVVQSIFPRISYLFSVKNDEVYILIRKSIAICGCLALVVSSLMLIFSANIIELVIGNNYKTSIVVLEILSIVVFISVINNFLGVQILLPLGYKKEFSRIVLISGLLSMLVMIPLSYLYSEIGAAVSILFAEVIVLLSLLWFHKIYDTGLIKLSIN